MPRVIRFRIFKYPLIAAVTRIACAPVVICPYPVRPAVRQVTAQVVLFDKIDQSFLFIVRMKVVLFIFSIGVTGIVDAYSFP